jgi:hypothetical protein
MDFGGTGITPAQRSLVGLTVVLPWNFPEHDTYIRIYILDQNVCTYV